MPLTKTTINLADEYDRLTEEMTTFAQRQAEADSGTTAAQRAAQQGQRAERLRAGVAWARNYPDSDVEGSGWNVDNVVLCALTNGERHRVNDTAEETGWKRSDCYVAAGTVTAPYVEHDPDAITQADFEDTVLNVVDLHPSFVDWAEDRITDISRVGTEGKSYLQLVTENASTTSPTTNG